jgi:hypothetical protein
MMDTLIMNAHLENTTLEQMKALTPGERVALDSLQGAMLELLDSLNDPELAEVESDPGSLLFSPTAASPPAAAALSLTSQKIQLPLPVRICLLLKTVCIVIIGALRKHISISKSKGKAGNS